MEGPPASAPHHVTSLEEPRDPPRGPLDPPPPTTRDASREMLSVTARVCCRGSRVGQRAPASQGGKHLVLLAQNWGAFLFFFWGGGSGRTGYPGPYPSSPGFSSCATAYLETFMHIDDRGCSPKRRVKTPRPRNLRKCRFALEHK